MPDDFYNSDGEKEIPAPSCVQYFGYDHFQYTSTRFPFDPPYIPAKNPAYHYSRYFDCDKTSEKTYIVFEGVDSCFYLYINGKEVGYSQISHLISEFDITEYVKTGKNKIHVSVLKWNKGSYLENQDKLRFIIRYLYAYARSRQYAVRIGFCIKLDKSFDKLKYNAYGDDETYSDMYEYAIKDEFMSSVAAQYKHYVKPQECGSHYSPDYAEVTDGAHTLRVEGMTSFSCLPYSAEQIESAKHDYELPTSDGTYLCADYYMSGLGTGACGPLTSEQYTVPSKGAGKITFTFGKAR